MISYNLYDVRLKECCGAPLSLAADADSPISDSRGTHFDGRPINGKRPFLVGHSRIIFLPARAPDRRAPQSVQLGRELNVDPMFRAKPRRCACAPSSRPPMLASASTNPVP